MMPELLKLQLWTLVITAVKVEVSIYLVKIQPKYVFNFQDLVKVKWK